MAKKFTHQKKAVKKAGIQKRHTFKSAAQLVKSKHVSTLASTATSLDFSAELDEAAKTQPAALLPAPLTLHLQHLSLLNLSLPFQALVKELTPLLPTHALLLFNADAVVRAFAAVLARPEETNIEDGSGAIPAVLELLPSLAKSLLGEILPSLPALIGPLLALGNSSHHLPLLFGPLPAFLKPLTPILLASEAKETLEAVFAVWRPFLVNASRGGKATNDDARRLAVEGWGNVVRRGGRGEVGDRLVGMLVAELQREPESRVGVALALVEAMKGPNGTLPSLTPSLVASLLRQLLALPADSAVSAARVLSNVITALIHHTSLQIVQMEPVLEVLLEVGKKVTEGGDEHQLALWMSALCVTTTVRNGKAIIASLLPKYLVLLPTLQPLALAKPSLLSKHLNLTSSLLQLANLPDWLKQRALVRALYTAIDPFSRKALVGLWVAEDAGKGWKRGGDVLLRPAVEETVVADFERECLAGLGLLGHLQHAGLLSQLPATSLEALACALAAILASVDVGALGEDELVLLDLSLVGLQGLTRQRTTFWPALVSLLEGFSSTGQASGGAAGAYAFGKTLAVVADLLALDAGGKKEVQTIVLPTLSTMLERHAVSSTVLHGLAQLLPLLSAPTDQLATYAPLLSSSLLASSSALRLSALIILSALAPADGTGAIVLQRAVELEELEISVEGAREKCLRVAKLGRALGSLEATETVYAEIGLRTMLAQLKVNLRPLYAAVHAALATLTPTAQATLIWQLLFAELALAASGEMADVESSAGPVWGVEMREWNGQDEEDVLVEDVRSFRDPPRTRREELLNVELRRDTGALFEAIKQSQEPAARDRLDVLNYEINLVNALTASPMLAERHSRDIVPVFLAFAARSPHLTSFISTPELAPGVFTGSRLNLKQLHAKLAAYLELLSKFTNPKALYRTDELYALYLSLLSKGDGKLQQLALDCLFTFKSGSITPYKDNITMLMDDARFRDTLTKFSLSAKENDVINPAHRQELLPILIRLLYGKLIQRRGKGAGVQTRKQAILAALAGCLPSELEVFVNLMLAPFAALEGASSSSSEFAFAADDVLANGIPGKQQIGFLTLLGDVLKPLGPQLVGFWPRLLGVTMELVHRAQKRLGKMKEDEDVPEDADLIIVAGNAEEAAAADEPEADEPEDDEPSHHIAPLRTVRQLGIKRFADFFKSAAAPVFDFSPYLPPAFRSFITPRLAALDAENTQAPSGLLELFAVWSGLEAQLPILVKYDRQLLAKVYSCLTATNVKAAVISKTFDIVERILAHASAAEDEDQRAFIVDDIVTPNTDELLDRLATLVENPVGLGPVRDELAKRQIRILSDLAAYVSNGSQSARLIGLLSPMLRQPHKVISEKTKTNILTIFENLVPLVPDFCDPTSDFFTRLYTLLATLFRTIRSRQARQALCRAFEKFAEADSSLQASTDVVVSLNAFSERRREEPDFDRRLEAYNLLNEKLYATLMPQEWLPILYNMLHFVQDPEEMAIRVNSAYAMRRFIELVAKRRDDEAIQSTFVRMLYPGLRNGLRSRVELVRTEILSVLAAAVGSCDHIPLMQEMAPLLAGGDSEASFFSNIHHIQIHRRVRALHRLSDLCDEGTLSNSSLLADVFLPLISHFIVGASGKVDHNLINETIATTGKVSRHLKWGAYNALVRQYLRLGRLKDDNEKYYVRTVVAVLDGFHFSMEDAVVEEPTKAPEPDVGDDVAQTEGADGDADAQVAADAATAEPTRSQAVRIADAVEAKLLPSLLQYLEQKDETEDSIRLPIAIGIVKVALNLPESTRDAQISRLLTTLSQVFRSKSQETRDLAKETIIKITVILGPSWLSSVVQEMKASLQRGPQLHILAFVIHAILVHVTALASADFSDLDDCVANVVAIAGEVVFGESGKDLQAEGFKTKMREVRSSTAKGLDTFQLVARLVSPGKLKSMLLPVREILQTTQVLRILQQVDDVLRRISTGLNSNERVTPGDMLVLCHTLVGQNSQFLKVKAKSSRLEANKVTASAKNFHVDMKRVVKKEADHYAANAQKFVAFGLELFVTGFRRGHFNFANPEILARLEPLVNVIGNTLYAADSGVVIAGLKATGSLVKCPLESLPAAIPTLVQQVFVIVKQSGGTDSEVCQAALKTLAVIMRDCKTVEISPKQLKYILDIITPDMEDPVRQSTLFTILRAIISRRFILADIYDIMDRVAELMVTGSSTQVQELCRVTLLQFLLDYPQGKGRLKKQMQFLAKNLAYTYESGRLSVMELISAVFNKFSLELIREYSDLFLVALVMVIANDDSIKCREFAAELVRSLFQRMDEDQRSKSVATLHTWAETSSQAQLPRLAAQVYGLFVDALKTDASPFVSMILLDLQAMLATSAVTLEAFETAQDEPSPFGMDIEDELDWQLPYQALNSLAKVLHVLPERVSSVEWQPVVGHMLFPHAWVRLASSRLLGMLFGTSPPLFDRARASATDLSPLQPRGLFDIARKSLLQLKGESIDEGLSMQVVKNMVYLGRCFALGPSEANAAFPAAVVEADDDSAPVDPYAEAEAEEEEEEEAPEEAPIDVDEEVSEEVAVTRALSNPLAWLFTKLSQTARHILITRPAIHGEVSPRRSLPIMAIFRLIAALYTVLPAEQVTPFLMQVLHPIQRVLDGDMKGEDEMRNLAIELQTLVQDKVGVSAFSSVWNSIARTKAMKRQARRNQRIIKVTTNPAAAAQRKEKRNEAKKESHKRRDRGFADNKLRERPLKARRTRDAKREEDD